MANRERKSTTCDECTSGITPPISSPKVQTELDPPQLTCAGGTDPLSWSSKVQSFVKGSCRVTIGQTPQTPLQLLPIMSDTFRFYPSLTPLPPTALRGSSRIPQQFSVPGLPISDFPRKSLNFPQKIGVSGGKVWALAAWTQEGPLQDLDDSPVSVELKLITSDTQFDRILGEAQQLEESVVIVWMATWCRKCIYLKPKLEKLAAEYYPRLRFYCVDVNTVPHKLVARAAVTKMPTIQLWKDSKKQAEVIGGHKAYLVVNEVREMIENECAK